MNGKRSAKTADIKNIILRNDYEKNTVYDFSQKVKESYPNWMPVENGLGVRADLVLRGIVNKELIICEAKKRGFKPYDIEQHAATVGKLIDKKPGITSGLMSHMHGVCFYPDEVVLFELHNSIIKSSSKVLGNRPSDAGKITKGRIVRGMPIWSMSINEFVRILQSGKTVSEISEIAKVISKKKYL